VVLLRINIIATIPLTNVGHRSSCLSAARVLPFAAGTFDAFSAISSLEHVDEPAGDRQALSEAARVQRPGGRGLVTLPFRSAGSVLELTPDLDLFQRHYSPQTLQRALIAPSGLREVGRRYYGERLPFDAFTRRLPSPLDWLRRPWDILLTRLLLWEVRDPTRADAVLVELEKPSPAAAPALPRRAGQQA